MSIGLANEFTRTLGRQFAENVFEKATGAFEKRFSTEAVTSDILNLVPAGFLEERKLRTLSREELEVKVAEKIKELRESNERLEEIVSERTKELEQMLLSNEQAAQMLVRRDFELTRANDRLRNLDEVKSNFISVVAHQLRTPLSGIKWTLNLLLNGDLGTLTNEQRTFLLKAYESNDRMISLVNDMLGADRIESGKMRYAFRPLQLLDVIDNVLYELLPQANTRSLTITFADRPGDLPQVNADPERIRAVFQNLLENAIKYSKTGGTISLSAKRGDTGMITIGIKDDGIGIPKEQQKNIFSRFFRATNAIQAETDGSGLGLYIVKNIVERHGGKIWFESSENEGVAFYITLPVASVSAASEGLGIATTRTDSSQPLDHAIQ
jgi:signal transduction histidine kinase